MMVEVFLVLIYFYNTIGPITVHNNLLYNILLHKLRYKRVCVHHQYRDH